MSEFLDSNILLYAHQRESGAKGRIALELIERLWRDGLGRLSLQVLQEFHVIATHKFGIPLSESVAIMRDYGQWRVFSPSTDDIVSAIQLEQEIGIHFWDAMIVHAALSMGCDSLWSEDLQHGREIQGLTIRNPFLPA